MLFESHLVLSVDVVSSVQNHCKKFKIKIFVKKKKKIKKIMTTTTNVMMSNHQLNLEHKSLMF